MPAVCHLHSSGVSFGKRQETSMKKWLLSFGLFVALLTGPLRAQDITGIWQGTLSAQGRDQRTQIRIVNDGGTMRATFASIDQGPGLLPGNVTFQSGVVKIVFPGINGTFEGPLAPDAGSIDGTWSQGPGSAKLLLKKVTAEVAWTPPAPPPRTPMPADWKPAFEVATIKPSNPDTPGQAITVRG